MKLTRFCRGVVKRARACSVAPAGLSRWQQWDLWRPTWRTSTLALIRYEPKLFLNDYRSMLASPPSSPVSFLPPKRPYLPIWFTYPARKLFRQFHQPGLVDKTSAASRCKLVENRAYQHVKVEKEKNLVLVRHYAVYNTINRALLLDIARPRLQQVV